jgi:hypothetical protein
MPWKGKQRRDDSGDEHLEFVPAVFARSMEEAEEYRQLLDDHDIPSIIGADEEEPPPAPRCGVGSMTRGLPVLVPEAMLDEASEVIAEHDDADEFGRDKEETDGEEDDQEQEGFLIDEGFDHGPGAPLDDQGQDTDEDDDEDPDTDVDLFEDDDSRDEEEEQEEDE